MGCSKTHFFAPFLKIAPPGLCLGCLVVGPLFEARWTSCGPSRFLYGVSSTGPGGLPLADCFSTLGRMNKNVINGIDALRGAPKLPLATYLLKGFRSSGESRISQVQQNAAKETSWPAQETKARLCQVEEGPTGSCQSCSRGREGHPRQPTERGSAGSTACCVNSGQSKTHFLLFWLHRAAGRGPKSPSRPCLEEHGQQVTRGRRSGEGPFCICKKQRPCQGRQAEHPQGRQSSPCF